MTIPYHHLGLDAAATWARYEAEERERVEREQRTAAVIPVAADLTDPQSDE